MENDGMESAVDLGTWLGRGQAFAAVAGRTGRNSADSARASAGRWPIKWCANWKNSQGVQHGSELIVFSAENAARLAFAIEELRARAESQPGTSAPTPEDPAARTN
jgi:hypothetical protein